MSGTLGSLSYNTFRHAGGGFLAFESSLEYGGDRFLNFNIIDYFTSKEVNEKTAVLPLFHLENTYLSDMAFGPFSLLFLFILFISHLELFCRFRICETLTVKGLDGLSAALK